jgi:hypothetical protein
MGGELADKGLLAWRTGCPNVPLRHGLKIGVEGLGVWKKERE